MLAIFVLASVVGMAPARLADFQREPASDDVARLAQWVLDSGNNRTLSFMIIDKKNTKIFVFDPNGKLHGATPALLGGAVGDDSVPGIGNRKLSSIRPEERTTPAGRFVAVLDRNLGGKDILWVDYANAISLHRVVTSNPKENRARRLASPTTADNRISYGCINVPARFFDKVVIPAFRKTIGIVYILPETRPIGAVFTSFDLRTQWLHRPDSGPTTPSVAVGTMVTHRPPHGSVLAALLHTAPAKSIDVKAL